MYDKSPHAPSPALWIYRTHAAQRTLKIICTHYEREDKEKLPGEYRQSVVRRPSSARMPARSMSPAMADPPFPALYRHRHDQLDG